MDMGLIGPGEQRVSSTGTLTQGATGQPQEALKGREAQTHCFTNSLLTQTGYFNIEQQNKEASLCEKYNIFHKPSLPPWS